jgi:hypothetical protein
MTLVDAKVWIDYFYGLSTPATQRLDQMLGHELVYIDDLSLAYVLKHVDQGKGKIADWLLHAIPIISIGGMNMAMQASHYLKQLSDKGLGSSTSCEKGHILDGFVAAYCIEHGYSLLFSDQAFIPYVQHFGLKTPA